MYIYIYIYIYTKLFCPTQPLCITLKNLEFFSEPLFRRTLANIDF